jgi:hypothetical protein
VEFGDECLNAANDIIDVAIFGRSTSRRMTGRLVADLH